MCVYMYVCISVWNVLGETWFSRLLQKIEDWTSCQNSHQKVQKSIINYKTSLVVGLLKAVFFVAIIFHIWFSRLLFGGNMIFSATVIGRRLKLFVNIPINMEHKLFKYKISMAVGLLLSRFFSCFYKRFSRLLLKIHDWIFLPLLPLLCTIVRYNKSMVVCMLKSCFSFYNFWRPYF